MSPRLMLKSSSGGLHFEWRGQFRRPEGTGRKRAKDVSNDVWSWIPSQSSWEGSLAPARRWWGFDSNTVPEHCTWKCRERQAPTYTWVEWSDSVCVREFCTSRVTSSLTFEVRLLSSELAPIKRYKTTKLVHLEKFDAQRQAPLLSDSEHLEAQEAASK